MPQPFVLGHFFHSKVCKKKGCLGTPYKGARLSPGFIAPIPDLC